LTVEELRGNETWEDYVQIANAYVVVMELATQFFPKSKKDDEKPEAEGEDKQKN
jgi:hypothetical protein